MRTSTMNLADIVEAFANNTAGAHDTFRDIRNLTLRAEVIRTILEQASTDPNSESATVREVVQKILAAWLSNDGDATTGEAAPPTLARALATLKAGTLSVSPQQLDVVLVWLISRNIWFAVEPLDTGYRITVEKDWWEILNNFVVNVVDAYFS